MFELFLHFLKIALSSFGGGSVILSLIQKQFVGTGIIPITVFTNAVAMSQATPGPIAGSISTYIGYYMYGFAGVIIANAAIALPSFIIVIAISNFINKNKYNNIVDSVFKFLRPVTVALIASVLLFFINISVFNGKFDSIFRIFQLIQINAFLIISILLIILYKFKLSPVKIIFISGILGMLLL